MSNVTAKFASAFLIGIAAGAVSMAPPSRAAGAADSCLTEPNGDNPQGKHWYYRIERGTGRHCWYLRGDEEKSARADEDKPVPAEKPAPRKIAAATSRSIADAHAEIAPRVRPATDDISAAAAPSVWPNPLTSNAAGSDAPSPAGPQPEASLMVAEAQPDAAADVPPPPVAAPPERKIGSIQKLALVAVGALTLAGLTGSAVYRLGRRRKRNDWLRERTEWQNAQNPHRPPWVDEPQPGPDPAVADLDEVSLAAPQSDFSIAMGEADAGGDPVEQIEEFLARLTRQLHEELESARPHSA